MTNKAEQGERRALAGSTAATTYHRQAQVAQGLELGGRFAKASVVVGAEPAVQYPPGPDWTRNEVPQEPPLGFSVNDLEPTGEPFEVERSLTQSAASEPASSPAVVETGGAANPTPKRRKLR
jgi:hypothetical protein